VVTCIHKRSKPCCTSESRASSILPWYGDPVDDPSQSLSSSATSHIHPFVVPTSETILVGLLLFGSSDLD
jgi:hypothetical protein